MDREYERMMSQVDREIDVERTKSAILSGILSVASFLGLITISILQAY